MEKSHRQVQEDIEKMLQEARDRADQDKRRPLGKKASDDDNFISGTPRPCIDFLMHENIILGEE